MKKTSILLLIFLTFIFYASGFESHNLLLNGKLEGEQAIFPNYWQNRTENRLVYTLGSGPDGMCSVKLRCGKSRSLFSQPGIILVPGEKYRLSAFFKTSNFKCKRGVFTIYDNGWRKSISTKVPPNTDWKRFSRTFTLFPSKGNLYGVAIWAENAQGSLEVAGIKLEALTEKGRKGASNFLTSKEISNLFPLFPLKNKIPYDRPELTLEWLGRLPEKIDNYSCKFKVGKLSGEAAFNRKNQVTLNLRGVELGDCKLETTICNNQTGKKEFEKDFDITIIRKPVLNYKNIKKLNNLVSELLNVTVSGSKTFEFCNPENGWIYLSVNKPNVKIFLDGKGINLRGQNDRPETVYPLNAGIYKLKVVNAPSKTKVIARSIPEILMYPPFENSPVEANGKYDANFREKYLWGAITTVITRSRWTPSATQQKEARSRYLRWISNMHYWYPSIPQNGEFAKRIENFKGWKQKKVFDGIVLDELFFTRYQRLLIYMREIRLVKNPDNRLIYTWTTDKPGNRIHSDFMSAITNVSGGNGKMLYETYCHSQKDEKTAKLYLNNMLVDGMQRFKLFYPAIAPSTAMVIGCFIQKPVISLDHFPSVDYKYFLDMEFNLIANNPQFAKLGGIGYYGINKIDEETLRWALKLMRHYAIEGKKGMLSNKYGFTYLPGHLKNGDFEEKLNYWDTKGNIYVDKVSGYASKSQGRWQAKPKNTGDSFAVFVHDNDKYSTLSQVAVNLKPGNLYSLNFIVADVDDIKKDRNNPRLLGLNVDIPGAEVIKGKSFVYIDRRPKTCFGKRIKNFARTNLHRIVFKASSNKHKIIFNNKQSVSNEKLALNFIQLKPYFQSEK